MFYIQMVETNDRCCLVESVTYFGPYDTREEAELKCDTLAPLWDDGKYGDVPYKVWWDDDAVGPQYCVVEGLPVAPKL